LVDIEATLETSATPEALFAWVEDLTAYPQWLSIVARVDPAKVGPSEAAWDVDLRGRFGPFARSKRLRMVRTLIDRPNAVVFERGELDSRSHSAWVLRVDVAPHLNGSALSMELSYGGGLWGPVLERMIGDEIQQSRQRLRVLAESGALPTF
jgi:hypothetical protein